MPERAELGVMNAIIFSALIGVVMMLGGIVIKSNAGIKLLAIILLFILLGSHLAEYYDLFNIHIQTHGMLAKSRFGMFFNTIIISLTLLYVLLSGDEIVKIGTYGAEYFALIFFSLCGATILSSYNNLLMLFLGVEIMTIPLFVLTSSEKKNLKSNEAGLKYFLMGSFSTGILLMGIALYYGGTGLFAIEASKAANEAQQAFRILLPLGLLFIFISLSFKVAAAPFHFWTPDVYDGAPSVFTSFMATIVKTAGFIAFIKLFELRSVDMGYSWKILLPLIIILTLLAGNITAVFQQSVKRMLAYSSIAHAGFMLFALYNPNDFGKQGIMLYTVAYSLATIGTFAVLTKMKDYTYEGYNGLAKTKPVLAATNTIFILSLAGIPLTAGFFAKYYMLASALKESTSNLWLVIVAVLFAAVSVYYYFRVIQAMYFKDGNAETTEIKPFFKTLLIIIAALIIVIGLMPSLLLDLFYA